ncbi:N-acyl-D-amino-acid deacylase family protein [Yinghuangia sp. YIM S09857]|uniref:N-acyl-D-amino-acid deacylase family protein n=1 Tax=Yinghuangia sp. YIM S09857 TaxID=3436929 RepID=UPI003F53E4BF
MDLVLRGATVVDGTGADPRPADVRIADGVIAAVGEPGSLAGDGATEVDLTGLVLAPGFIDIHTHFDAQVLWDPDLTPSSWHGVTSVLMGNCGFGIAPTRPAHRDLVARTLENVEGMSLDALHAGINWDFESFPDYLDTLTSARPRLNVAAMIGHTPLRLFVVGEEQERPATAEEIARMRALVAEAMEAGAFGFASSRATSHQGAGGRPVPSRHAERAEFDELAAVVGESGHGIIQVTAGPDLDVDHLLDVGAATGRPVTFTPLLTGMGAPGAAVARADACADTDVWGQTSCRPLVMQVTLADPFPFATMPSFQEILALPADKRAELYADPAWRERARAQAEERWDSRLAKTDIDETELPGLAGRTLPDLAAERGSTPFDVMVDTALAEDLRTRFRVVLANDDEHELAELLRHPRVLVGLSDAGAHASQLCDACFSTHLLEHWVRETGHLTLAEAVHRLTGQPAAFLGLADRGRIAPGLAADLVAFDPETVGVGAMERVYDLPAGADRLVAHSVGIVHVWVNGQAVRQDGADLDVDVRPGAVLRSGR